MRPYTYGLATWNITTLPTEENVEIVSPNYAEFPDHACEVLNAPKYANIYNQYDIVVVHNSNYDAANGLYIGRSDAGMGGRCGQVQAHWGAGLANDAPLPVLLHELLHSYEAHERNTAYEFNGVAGLHGATQHGYQEIGSQGEREWIEWYRYFMRGQVGEVTSLDPSHDLAAPIAPADADYFVGVFHGVRHGLWLAP